MSEIQDVKFAGVPNVCFSLTNKDYDKEPEYTQQRLNKGFDDSETWSLDTTIASFIIPRLERYLVLAPIKNADVKNDIELFLTAMKLTNTSSSAWTITDKQSEDIEKGLDAFPRIFKSLWW